MAKKGKVTITKYKQYRDNSREHIFETHAPPRDKLPDDLAKRLSDHLIKVVERLKTADVATRIGLNWQRELIRQAAKLTQLANAWPRAKHDLAAPDGQAWCNYCEEFSTIGFCNFGRCPIRQLKKKRPAKKAA